jgi:hypothetical protein
MALSGRAVKLGRSRIPLGRPSTPSLSDPGRETSRVSGYNRAGGPEWNSPMYVFANEGPLIQVRARLVRGADGRTVKCARRKRTWGRPPRQLFVIQLAEETEEWRHRHGRRTREHELP